jgi:hypothetical protein
MGDNCTNTNVETRLHGNDNVKTPSSDSTIAFTATNPSTRPLLSATETQMLDRNTSITTTNTIIPIIASNISTTTTTTTTNITSPEIDAFTSTTITSGTNPVTTASTTINGDEDEDDTTIEPNAKRQRLLSPDVKHDRGVMMPEDTTNVVSTTTTTTATTASIDPQHQQGNDIQDTTAYKNPDPPTQENAHDMDVDGL